MRLVIASLNVALLLASASANSGQALYELDAENNDPLADPSSIVLVDGARFTVLSDHLIRAEQLTDLTSNFEDRPTVSTLNRKLPVPSFTSSTSDCETLTITTSAVTLSYKINKPFAEDTLTVTSNDDSSVFNNWSYGMEIKKSDQLPGTIRTLDGQGSDSLYCDEMPEPFDGESFHCTMALFSRAGFSVYNDATTPVFNDDGFWAGENENDIDLYLYFHGLDFKLALKEYSMIGGKMPVPPRYALGPWFTRWIAYNQYSLDEILKEYELRSLPLDVVVLDMNWHKKDDWTGYSFDSKLFPYYGETLVAMKEKYGLHLSVNVHDADGVKSFEDHYQDMADAVGFDTSNNEDIPFLSCSNSTYAYALEDTVLKPLEEESGVDFFWIDWQQGGTQGGCSGERENPTILTNKLRVTDKARRGGDDKNERGMVLARWGGLGNHRYQVGFSGDVDQVTWENLAYQPYFSSTSANVGFSLWSHDLVGAKDDDELFLRWLQWGAFSAIFRTHDRGMSSGDCADDAAGCNSLLPWDLPQGMFESARDVMRRRSELMPYIYSSVKKTHNDLTAMLRPMYHDYPSYDDAYGSCTIDGVMSQYMFGDDMIIAPVVIKSDDVTLLSEKKVWVPPGDWVDNLGRVLTGPRMMVIDVALDEVPTLVKSGAVIATTVLGSGTSNFGNAQRMFDELVFTIYPTSFDESSKGKSVIWEDDGKTTDYYHGVDESAKELTFMYEFVVGENGISLNVNFDAMEGRKAVVVVESCPLPESSGGYEYDPQRATCTFELGEGGEGTLHFTGNVTPESFGGWRGVLKRANDAKNLLDEAHMTPGSMSGQQDEGGYLMTLASLGAQLYHAVGEGNEDFVNTIAGEVEYLLIQTKEELDGLVIDNADGEHDVRVKRARALMDVFFKA